MQPGDALRFGFPRTDLTVIADGVTLKPTLALGSWVAFKRMTSSNETMVMGDLVLTEDEVTPVMTALQQGGVEQTALHHHVFRESPRVLYMHIDAHGDATKIAQAIRAALAASKTPMTAASAAPATPLDLDTAAIARTLGVSGRMNGGVYGVNAPRAERIMAHGMEVPPSMGVATVMNFQPLGGGRAAITGDFVMTAAEVNPVIRALRERGIEVTALHSHMLDETPRLFFMHFWAKDDAVKLATALRAALDKTARPAPTPPAARPGAGPTAQGAEADTPLLTRFDANRNQRLDRAERDSARAYLAAHPELRQPMRGQRLPSTGTAGAKVSPRDVRRYPASTDLYAPESLRTVFLTFENDNWERELADFWHTDVEVPAVLEMDGKVYRDVGVNFRGNNSFHMVPDGNKRSFAINLDTWRAQDLLGHTSLNLLNANQDPTLLRSVLYLDVAREYIPAPKANFVRVVVNGTLWGVYVNQQTFSKQLLAERMGSTAGTRWKSPNNSFGGGFNYLGDDLALYRRWYEMKGADDTVAWRALANVTKVLNTTPPDRLEAALARIMDIDEVLRFLALDVALVNGDGYWNDGSDFNVLRDAQGRFQALPHDVNEGFRARGNGASPDPLVALTDTNKALRGRLLQVPALRTRYLKYVGDIADRWLDSTRLAPHIERYVRLIEADVARDTRKTTTTDAFRSGIAPRGGDTTPPVTTLLGFAAARRAALLNNPAVQQARKPH